MVDHPQREGDARGVFAIIKVCVSNGGREEEGKGREQKFNHGALAQGVDEDGIKQKSYSLYNLRGFQSLCVCTYPSLN